MGTTGQYRRRHRIRASLREFVLPPIDDGLVLGRESPIGYVAVGRALELLAVRAFQHVETDDEVIGDILVRSAILRKISEDQVRDFVLTEIKPLMGAEEIIQLDLQVEVDLEREQ
ncbi:hypothetical protein [Thioalkalivibrio sp. ALgr3]|uniref:hypothetical protein n=1 Tax=Thioalkalivibrio sp. ALgr3 TaxID=1239292 RepID=UPI00036B5CC0|nr:hypothetical protein [Thioalkalivibrio sp. ALgr3]